MALTFRSAALILALQIRIIAVFVFCTFYLALMILADLSIGTITIDLALPFALVILAELPLWAVLVLDAFYAPTILAVRAILRAVSIHGALLTLAIDTYE
jgi:hypothetical protein